MVSINRRRRFIEQPSLVTAVTVAPFTLSTGAQVTLGTAWYRSRKHGVERIRRVVHVGR